MSFKPPGEKASTHMNNMDPHKLDESLLAALRRVAQDRTLLGGLATAYAAFALTFRGPREQFWSRMTLTGLSLGSLALASEPDLRRTRIHAQDVVVGLASAGVLYVIFIGGDRLARAILPHGAAEIDDIYTLGTFGKKLELAARISFVIGPAEELFWRGLVQKRLIQHLGRVPGTILGIAAYGGAHLVTGNLTLIGAASVAGTFWGSLSSLGVPMGALLVSHASWDIYAFLIAPFATPASSP